MRESLLPDGAPGGDAFRNASRTLRYTRDHTTYNSLVGYLIPQQRLHGLTLGTSQVFSMVFAD